MVGVQVTVIRYDFAKVSLLVTNPDTWLNTATWDIPGRQAFEFTQSSQVIPLKIDSQIRTLLCFPHLISLIISCASMETVACKVSRFQMC